MNLAALVGLVLVLVFMSRPAKAYMARYTSVMGYQISPQSTLSGPVQRSQ